MIAKAIRKIFRDQFTQHIAIIAVTILLVTIAMSSKEPWSALSAMGTIGAVITALFFGLRDVILSYEDRRIEEAMLQALLDQECIDILKRSEALKHMLNRKADSNLGYMLIYEHARAYASLPALTNTNKLFSRIKSLGYERATAVARIISNWASLIESINKTAVENENGAASGLIDSGIKSALVHIKKIQEDVAIVLGISNAEVEEMLRETIDIGMAKTPRMKTIEDRIREAGFTNPSHS